MKGIGYYPAVSYWHLRDPRLKLGVMIIGATLILTENTLPGQLFLLTFNLLLLVSAHLPLKRGWQVIVAFRWLLGLTFLLNLVTGTVAGAFLYFGRILNLLMLSSWLLGVTEALTLIKGVELTLWPFRRFLPVGEIAMALGLALSFFPLLLEEAGEIMLAQQARGVTFQTKWTRKIRGLLSMVIPLFISALRRALEIAQAMEARGYVPGEPRGSLYALVWGRKDTLCSLLILLFSLLWWGKGMIG
ncbi:MAG: energy-coupling factor transporter transmembrane protein EcfT [Firmicutes bacterium]|nr:energy-coupling factor transporter transmembrane protein EcfT [Bacillota bacterium]